MTGTIAQAKKRATAALRTREYQQAIDLTAIRCACDHALRLPVASRAHLCNQSID
jgi:hypothetical protein